jgi:hypothetical protein
MKLVATYVSPTRPLIDSDLTWYLSGLFPFSMAGDFNAKSTDWNTTLNKVRDSLLPDYANRTSSLINGPDFPTMAPYIQMLPPTYLM